MGGGGVSGSGSVECSEVWFFLVPLPFFLILIFLSVSGRGWF